jgi:hypothetical protein
MGGKTATAIIWPLEGEPHRERIQDGTREIWICGQNVSQALGKRQEDVPCMCGSLDHIVPDCRKAKTFSPEFQQDQQPHPDGQIIMHQV